LSLHCKSARNERHELQQESYGISGELGHKHPRHKTAKQTSRKILARHFLHFGKIGTSDKC